MNIFILHLNQSTCVKMYVNKHVIKMILESCQLLCSVHHVCDSKYVPVYKLTHKNHPCSIWARESLTNYKWLIVLAKELCKEYTYRYGKIHKCESYINDLEKNLPPIEDKGFTPPAQAMPDIYKDSDVVEAYRHYYFFEKNNLFDWKKRPIPGFIKEYRQIFE